MQAMNRTHSAKYLILLGPKEAPRALLFNCQRDYLAEMIDDEDGLMVENLLKSSRVCPTPRDLTFDALVEPRHLADGQGVRCFALGN
jgi:hypothetical protein